MEETGEAVVAAPSTSNESYISENKLGQCEVCAFFPAKYTCPRCEVKTCSLRCNKIHKIEIECNGERDKAKFIPMQKFTNLDLSSDYRLLEEITRSIETSKKKFGKRMKFEIPFPLIKLRNGAAARNTKLQFLPNTFKKHKNNTTTFNAKENLIYWHVDWVFVNAENLCLSDMKVPENQKIGSVLSNHLNQKNDTDLQDKLQFYQSKGYSGIRILLRAERKKGRKFYEVDLDMTLKECLKNKLVIEYPTFHVLFKDHAEQFDIVDSDCEEEISDKIKSGSKVVDDIIKHADSSESLYNALQNLLFASEHDDDELSN